MQDSKILSLEQVSKYFYTSSGFFSHGKHFAALDNVSLGVAAGSSIGIVGESGSGKTTIARLMCSIYKADKGRVLYDGKEISALSKREKQEYVKNVQMVFQDPDNTLNPKLTIKSALSDGIKKYITKDKDEIQEKLNQLMEMVGLPYEYLERYSHEFSGGQRQRISIARALSINPKVIIADEPVSSLDVSVQAQILNLMKALQKNGITLILISHSLAVVSNLCENIAVMQKGKLEEYGNTLEVLSNPKSEYTKNLLASSSYTVIKNN
ncbi:MAG: ATP-binding cassette domain-containing protein [Mucispirillum sp.]|nr:ATP-binding cassette domain-containing protein [Mucispirillum sp.]